MDKTTILLCEICREPIATFVQEDVVVADAGQPVNLQAFKSLYPDRQVPNPFPAALDDWRVAACPRCRRRPFFNFFDKGDGTVIVANGDPVPEGQQWYLMILGDSGLPEKLLLSDIKPEVPPEQPTEQPPQETTDAVAILHNRYVGDDQERLDALEDARHEDQEPEPTGNYKSPPVICPTCGKKFRSAGRMAKYHTPCPSLPPQEGFRI